MFSLKVSQYGGKSLQKLYDLCPLKVSPYNLDMQQFLFQAYVRLAWKIRKTIFVFPATIMGFVQGKNCGQDKDVCSLNTMYIFS